VLTIKTIKRISNNLTVIGSALLTTITIKFLLVYSTQKYFNSFNSSQGDSEEIRSNYLGGDST
jgi:hypothetical protein